MARKILMATMGLNIGGAETHIVELAKNLKKQGMEIVIASNGGVYVEEIEAAGIRHYTVPMHVRSFRTMARSYFMLKKIISAERPDIVHAHARIPAFICALLRRKLHFPFVTTAHWVFETGGGLKYLTNWGQKTIAVSNDIRDYLMENYGVPPEDIFVTINGIDTDKFSPDRDGNEVAERFGIDRNRPVLSHVSRLDEDRALTARILIDIAPKLVAALPDLQILIVGGGDVFAELKAKADAINAGIGRTCLIMAGPQTDIASFVAVGDVFIGVSRAALEAMAEEKPVIVAGNEGYMGIFDESKLANAMENNFCCRGWSLPEGETMAADIITCFCHLPASHLRELGVYGRQVILEHYSVDKMAKDCLAAYDQVWPARYRVLLSGYYGFRNTGDDAILQTINANIEDISDDVAITVLSNDPKETKRVFGYHSVYRYNPFQVTRAVNDCDVLISGGGSLLQDSTSTRSLLYYLKIIHMAKRRNKKVMLYANGIGPVRQNKNRRRVLKALAEVDMITLRDNHSASELYNIGVRRDDIHVTADPVFTMDSAADSAVDHILERNRIPCDEPFLAVSIRRWPGMDTACRQMAAVCDHIYQRYGLPVVFIPMQTPHDITVSRTMAEHLTAPFSILETPCSPQEVMGVIGRARAVFSMRLHTLIFAARMAVPFAGMIYDPKVGYYLDMMESPSAGHVNDFDIDTAEKALCEIIDHHDDYVALLSRKVEDLQVLAKENEAYLLDLLER